MRKIRRNNSSGSTGSSSSNDERDYNITYHSLDTTVFGDLCVMKWDLAKDQPGRQTMLWDSRKYEVESTIDDSLLPSAELGKALARRHGSGHCLNLMFHRWTRFHLGDSFNDCDISELVNEKAYQNDRTAELCREYGEDKCSEIMDNMIDDCAKAYLAASTKDKSNQPLGRDVGMPFTYPLACVIAHAIKNECASINRILASLTRFWYAYADNLRRKQRKDKKFITEAYRNGMGWCGWYLYIAYYRMEAFTDVLPLDGVSEEDERIVLESIGLMGLKMMRWGFGACPEDASLPMEELQKLMDDIIQEEVETLRAVDFVNQRLHTRRRKSARLPKQSSRQSDSDLVLSPSLKPGSNQLLANGSFVVPDLLSH